MSHPHRGAYLYSNIQLASGLTKQATCHSPKSREIQCMSFIGVASIAIHTSQGSDHYAEHQLLFSVRYRSCSGWMASVLFSILVEVNQDDTSVNQTNVGPQHLYIWLSTGPVREELLEQYAPGKRGTFLRYFLWCLRPQSSLISPTSVCTNSISLERICELPLPVI